MPRRLSMGSQTVTTALDRRILRDAKSPPAPPSLLAFSAALSTVIYQLILPPRAAPRYMQSPAIASDLGLPPSFFGRSLLRADRCSSHRLSSDSGVGACGNVDRFISCTQHRPILPPRAAPRYMQSPDIASDLGLPPLFSAVHYCPQIRAHHSDFRPTPPGTRTPSLPSPESSSCQPRCWSR